MTTDADIAKVFRDAITHIRKGWCQGEQYIKNDRGEIVACCLLGGLALATPGVARINYERYETACDFIREHIGTDLALHKWNDAPGRTQDEVIEALESAAKSLEGVHDGQ